MLTLAVIVDELMTNTDGDDTASEARWREVPTEIISSIANATEVAVRRFQSLDHVAKQAAKNAGRVNDKVRQVATGIESSLRNGNGGDNPSTTSAEPAAGGADGEAGQKLTAHRDIWF
jgi:hypothetical protein